VLVHASSFSSEWLTTPAVGASAGNAPTICDRLLITVTPVQRRKLHLKAKFEGGSSCFSFDRAKQARSARRLPGVNLESTWGQPAPPYPGSQAEHERQEQQPEVKQPQQRAGPHALLTGPQQTFLTTSEDAI